MLDLMFAMCPMDIYVSESLNFQVIELLTQLDMLPSFETHHISSIFANEGSLESGFKLPMFEELKSQQLNVFYS